jgi:hypothetical protein
MKYFTRSWVNGELTNEESDNIIDSYSSHLNTLLPVLPITLVELAKTSLHDGLIESVIINRLDNSVIMILLIGNLSIGYSRLKITYCGVDINSLDCEIFKSIGY